MTSFIVLAALMFVAFTFLMLDRRRTRSYQSYRRTSYRADLFNSVSDEDLRTAAGVATAAACLAASTVIIS